MMKGQLYRARPANSINTAHCVHSRSCRSLVCAVSAKGSQPRQQPEVSTSTSNSEAASQQPVSREFRALGSKVVETNVPFTGPEDKEDFWEGEKFDAFGKVLENYFIPGLIVLGLLCGGIAARTYNEGATEYIKPPTGPDAAPSIIIATPDGMEAAPSISE